MIDIKDLVLASANKGKIKELQDMLGGLGINIIPQQQLGIEDAEKLGLPLLKTLFLKHAMQQKFLVCPLLPMTLGLKLTT